MGLTRGIASALVVMLTAGAAPALAADPPADAKTAPEAETTSQDAAPAAPSFLQSIEVYGLVDGYYGWAFNEVGPALRNFDVNHNNFSLNYVEFAIAKPVTSRTRVLTRA